MADSQTTERQGWRRYLVLVVAALVFLELATDLIGLNDLIDKAFSNLPGEPNVYRIIFEVCLLYVLIVQPLVVRPLIGILRRRVREHSEGDATSPS